MTVTHWHGLYSETQLDYAIDGSETVSYTHLDVYKRQLHSRADGGIGGTAFREGASFAKI